MREPARRLRRREPIVDICPERSRYFVNVVAADWLEGFRLVFVVVAVPNMTVPALFVAPGAVVKLTVVLPNPVTRKAAVENETVAGCVRDAVPVIATV